MTKISSLVTKAILLSLFFLTVAPVVTPTTSKALAQTSSISGTYVSDNAQDNVLTKTMCQVMKIVTGKAGKAFAAFAIISIGIGFFTGKVSWGLMIGVAAGIAAIFGAPSIVAAITGGQAFNCGS